MADNVFKKVVDFLNTPLPGTGKKKTTAAKPAPATKPAPGKGEAKATDIQKSIVKRDDQLAKAQARAQAKKNAELQRKLMEQRAELNRMRREYEQEMAKEAQSHASTESWTHTVVPGDTLSGIAKKYYGNAARWPDIHKANKDKIANPNLIYPGQVFVIPGKE
jgi:nucleoid-associated protein YgaU